MENFLNLKPKDIKILKEKVQEVFNLSEETEIEEEKVGAYMELVDFFEDIAGDLKQRLYNITGFNSEDDTEEAEESKGN